MDDDPLLREAITQWHEALVLGGASPASRVRYHTHLQDFATDLEEVLGRTPLLADCTRARLRTCMLRYQHRPDRRRSPAADAPVFERARRSLEARRTALRSFFRWCVAEERVDADPTRLLTLPTQTPSAKPRSLTLADASLLRDAAAASRQPERDLLILALTLGSGCSLGELAALRLTDFDFAATTLTVTAKRTRAGASSRTLRLSPATRAALEAYLPVREARLARSAAGGSTFLLLTGSEVLATRSRSLGRHLERLSARCGLDASSHTLRASFATLSLEAGSSVREVQSALGISLAALRTMLPPPGDTPVGVSAHPWG